jgi:hypothetical protein
MITVVTPYFNPCGFETRRDLYWKWRDTLFQRTDCKLITVELAFGKQEIEDSLCFQGTDDNFMWQKEALLNIGFESVCGETEYIAWIDNDIDVGFDLHAAICKLRAHTYVQLFKDVLYEDPKGDSIKKGLVWNCQRNRNYQGAPGGAWMVKRKTGLKLYDRCIVGGGDQPLADSMVGKRTGFFWDGASPAQRKDFVRYGKTIERSVTYVDSRAIHGYHGDLNARQYIGRRRIVKDFHPYRDVKKVNGILQFTEFAPLRMRRQIKEYFYARNG